MDEPIIPDHVRRRQQRSRNIRGRQFSLMLFTFLIIAGLVAAAYHIFIPKDEPFVLSFFTYAEVGSRDFLETFTTCGYVRPRFTYPLASDISGQIEEVYVHEGEYVQAGDPILRLYSEKLVEEHRQQRMPHQG